MDDFISKPVDPDTFYATIARVFTRITAPTNTASDHPHETSPATKLEGVRILLAEDEPFNQQIAAEILSMVGAIVQVADNGEMALNLLAQETFDCVLMDMQMPVLNGLEATRQIRANPALNQQLIIAMTANNSPEDESKCREAGMNAFMSKPVDPEKLVSILAAHMTS